MDNFFEKIYIINLKRSPERKADMISQLEKNNVKNYIFIPTIDGKEIDCEVIYNISIANLKDEFAQVINSKKLFKLLS